MKNLNFRVFFLQASQTVTSRRQCLTCLCSTMALIVAPGISGSDHKANALEGKEKAGCRNCGGSGAIICKFRETFLISNGHSYI